MALKKKRQKKKTPTFQDKTLIIIASLDYNINQFYK